ncbi:MAG TPA: CHAD domain-containing protein [Candidatus Binatia bacterium]|nr:CHAD domain-containing protein [Candidatus Binatia bacterium]
MPIDAKRGRMVFEKLERDLLKLCSKPRAENVHGFRTGTRRVQILLGELSPHLARNQKKLLKMLDRIRKRAGKVRDLDVQLAALRALKTAHEPRRKTQLVQQLIELRGEQEKKLRKAVDDDTVSDIRKRLKRAEKNFKPQSSRDPLEAARAMLKVMDRQVEMTEALLHHYRILTKRARYAAEFAGQSAEAKKFIADLKRIQDALGDWHDWLTLRQSAVRHVGEVRESPLVAELHNVTGAKFRHAVAVLSQVRAAQIPAKTATVVPTAAGPRKARAAKSAA